MSFSLRIRQALYLLSVPNFGTASYWQLVEKCGSLEAVFQSEISRIAPYCKKDTLDALTLSQKQGSHAPLWQHVDALCEWLTTQGIHVLDNAHPDYPLLLKSIIKPPPLIFVKGNINTLALPQIAIVGSRKITVSGEKTTLSFAKGLTQSGFTVTSGLALGVDASAHQGALNANGKTIAVMATGIDAIYPKKHQYLAEQIIDNDGALVTEFFPHSSPRAHHFPQRNRIISGLSCGLLVVEAALKSGSLISAKYAIEQNRDVFAVPGSIHSPVSKGCHMLIKNGAKLVETAEDIVEELGSLLGLHANTLDSHANTLDSHTDSVGDKPTITSAQSNKLTSSKAVATDTSLPKSECTVLRCIDYCVTPLDDIMAHCGVPIDQLMSRLLELELEGVITHNGAGYTRIG